MRERESVCVGGGEGVYECVCFVAVVVRSQLSGSYPSLFGRPRLQVSLCAVVLCGWGRLCLLLWHHHQDGVTSSGAV